MVTSHVFHLRPLDGKHSLRYHDLRLDAFNHKTWLLVGSHLTHERKLWQLLNDDPLRQQWHGKTVIDAGAWLGDFSIFCAAEHASCVVVAIEPNAQHVDFMKNVRKANPMRLSNLWIVHGVLSDKDDEYYTCATTHVAQPNAQYKALVAGATSKKDAILSKSVDTLVSILGLSRPVGLLHLDVEGMEAKVLEGSRRILQTDRPVVVVEMLGSLTYETILQLFKNTGYRMHCVVPERCAWADFADVKGCRNIIFVPC